MRRTVALAFAVWLALPWMATAADPGPQPQAAGFRTTVLETFWNWVSAALPWLQSAPTPAPTSGVKGGGGPTNPTDPLITPLNGSCLDPDGNRIPCSPGV